MCYNKIYTKKKYGALKKIEQAVYLPEGYFWIGITGTLFFMSFYGPWLRNDSFTWLGDIFLSSFVCLGLSIQFAQANSRIYYDKEHIYYSTWLGHKITFDYTDITGKKNGLDTILVTNKKRNIRVETAGIGRKKFLRFVQLRLKEIKKNEIELNTAEIKEAKK